MINTYNESNLHLTLKKIYSSEEPSTTEAEADGYVYDILQESGNIIEIQTQGLSKLLAKLSNALLKKRKITVVYPLVVKKTILLLDENGNTISKRKSPVSKTIYSLFQELTGLYPILLEKDFLLEVVFSEITEVRTQTKNPVQSKNGRRRFKRNWLKTDKKLDKIIKIMQFKTANDYLNLLPQNLESPFSAKDLKNALLAQGVSKKESNNAHLIIWVLSKMGLLEHVGFKNKSRLYKII